ncbi:MAG: hypothetical protein K0B08_10175 [Bacteroidales bacterium]|nr:hypothetical protein [Bacteroidales bacterium]
MERQSFFHWLNDPLTLDTGSLRDLQQLTRDYPFFQTARLLFTLNLQLLNDYRFEGELRRCSVYAPDRAKLKDWISMVNNYLASRGSETPASQATVLEADKPDKDYLIRDLEDQIKSRLREIELNQARLQELIEKKKEITGPVAQHDILRDDMSRIRPLPKDELLDEFIAGRQQEQTEKAVFFSPEESARRSIEENDGILSETLARLVAAQGKIEKAIKIYQRLMLKNPQKSSYFAAQIEKLKKEL